MVKKGGCRCSLVDVDAQRARARERPEQQMCSDTQHYQQQLQDVTGRQASAKTGAAAAVVMFGVGARNPLPLEGRRATGKATVTTNNAQEKTPDSASQSTAAATGKCRRRSAGAPKRPNACVFRNRKRQKV